MLRSMNQLFGYALEARDGRIGKVDDFYFDDYVWRVRYLVATTGGWLNRKEVLISPAAVDSPHPEDKIIPVKLTKDQVRDSPDVDTDKPVSRQMEESMSVYYGWPSYWSMEPFAMAAAPEMASSVPVEAVGMPGGDPHLRSVRDSAGYQVVASDREEGLGEVTDFIIDDNDWTLRYVVVKLTAEGGIREVVLNPWWNREIDWARHTMYFDLPAAQILASPEFDPASPFDRKYESQLHDYYGRPGYWR
jgi:hypothetical protein